MKSPVLPSHPLNHPGVMKIALSHAASEALRAAGDHWLLVAAPADATAPEGMDGRMILLCLPTEKARLDDAYRVAAGTHKARKIAVAQSRLAADKRNQVASRAGLLPQISVEHHS